MPTWYWCDLQCTQLQRFIYHYTRWESTYGTKENKAPTVWWIQEKSLGVVNFRVTYGSQTQVLEFHVFSGSYKLLLFAQTCQKLGLLKLWSQAEVLSLHEKHIPLTTHSILQDCRDVVEGLGHISCSSFTVDPTAVPVQHTSWRIPVALRNEVKAKFADLETKGIIKKETAPTEWISNMVVVAKPGKNRIFLDKSSSVQSIKCQLLKKCF